MRSPSGKFVLRVPPSLHRRLKEEARSKGQSLNSLCVNKLQNAMVSTPISIIPTRLGPDEVILPDMIHLWKELLAGLVLFGSAVRGEATEVSDVDLLLVMDSRVRITPSLYRQWDELLAAKSKSTNIITPQFARLPNSVFDAGGLWYEIAVDGRVLWERDLLVSRFLGAIREAMAQGRIRRGMLHGSPYWVKEFEEQDAQ